MAIINFLTTFTIVVAILSAGSANQLFIVVSMFGSSNGKLVKVPFVLSCASSTFINAAIELWTLLALRANQFVSRSATFVHILH